MSTVSLPGICPTSLDAKFWGRLCAFTHLSLFKFRCLLNSSFILNTSLSHLFHMIDFLSYQNILFCLNMFYRFYSVHLDFKRFILQYSIYIYAARSCEPCPCVCVQHSSHNHNHYNHTPCSKQNKGAL